MSKYVDGREVKTCGSCHHRTEAGTCFWSNEDVSPDLLVELAADGGSCHAFAAREVSGTVTPLGWIAVEVV
jgi:hypothetical protein